MRRWVKVSVTAAVVLGLGGYFAEPYAQHWMLAGSACDGAMPRDAVERLVPEDALLMGEESRENRILGSYYCGVTYKGEETKREDGSDLVAVAAYTRRDDQDREFTRAFDDEHRFVPVADGLPGFIDRSGSITLLLPCPDLGKDDEGRPRKMLVRTWIGHNTNRKAPGVAYRVAVGLTNSASKKLGCGAEPLKAPTSGAVPVDPFDDDDGPKAVPLSRAKGTACAWVADAGLPQEASDGWQVLVASNKEAPTERCDLSAQGGKYAQREWGMSFTAWYGDWSNGLTFEGDLGGPRRETATARCDGEAANFALNAYGDAPGVDEAARQRMLKRFAEDQVRRHGCSGLRFTF
ncbi:hypothetical protein [Streptomyces sp. NPDC000410]|uniref:hypothetical protein n=1 Tax=Streptomyces sp. NPDC000410 TaxID=3154254 RepID=UPI00332C07AE